jgi:hypothetical protein
MAFKARHRYIAYPGINFKNHMFTGTIWPIQGKNDAEYEVEMVAKGLTCSCPGFTFHGKCRHIDRIGGRLVAA